MLFSPLPNWVKLINEHRVLSRNNDETDELSLHVQRSRRGSESIRERGLKQHQELNDYSPLSQYSNLSHYIEY
jgi:hypothetical protein